MAAVPAQLRRTRLPCRRRCPCPHCRRRTRFHHPRSSLPSMNHQTPDTCLRPCIRMWLCTSRLHKAMCSRMTSLSRLETSDHFHNQCSSCPCGLKMTGMCRRGTLRTTLRIGVGRLSRRSNSRMASPILAQRSGQFDNPRSGSVRQCHTFLAHIGCSRLAAWILRSRHIGQHRRDGTLKPVVMRRTAQLHTTCKT